MPAPQDPGAARPLPANYFELTFNAEADRAYRLWLRGRARTMRTATTRSYVQFSGSVTASGRREPDRHDRSDCVVIEDCSGCGVSGWGWQDNGYGTTCSGR